MSTCGVRTRCTVGPNVLLENGSGKPWTGACGEVSTSPSSMQVTEEVYIDTGTRELTGDQLWCKCI